MTAQLFCERDSILDKPSLGLPQLTLTDYVSLTAALPTPTLKQMEDFARFVSHAHSWYKHLPLLPPGVPFHFFIDPFAGMQRVVAPNGTLQLTERVGKGFHYSWLPTEEYRNRFGYLAFVQSFSSSISLLQSDGQRLIPTDDAAYIFDPVKQLYFGLPSVVWETGAVRVSGIVHTLAGNYDLWRYVCELKSLPDWPEESGGMQCLQGIISRCRTIFGDNSKVVQLSFEDPAVHHNYDLCCVDWPLQQLIEPERQRQQRHMVEAMHRMLELLASGSPPGRTAANAGKTTPGTTSGQSESSVDGTNAKSM